MKGGTSIWLIQEALTSRSSRPIIGKGFPTFITVDHEPLRPGYVDKNRALHERLAILVLEKDQ